MSVLCESDVTIEWCYYTLEHQFLEMTSSFILEYNLEKMNRIFRGKQGAGLEKLQMASEKVE